MSENSCVNPVWPCAMTGAASVLAGFSDLCVIIHGSSGCYYYPRSLLKVPMYSTYLLESEIVLGTVDRLFEVVQNVSGTGKPVAVLNTCIPALTGEDLKNAIRSEEDKVIFVDAPGFSGNVEEGSVKAFEALATKIDPNRIGVNIDGISLLDLFWRGNLHEAERLFSMLGISVAVRFAKDTIVNLRQGASRYSISVNPSFNSNVGENLGSLLFPDIPKTLEKLSEIFPAADIDQVLSERERAEEQMFYSCDKYLRKYHPPVVAVAAQESYAVFAKQMMEKYFGSDVPVLFARNKSASQIPYCIDAKKICEAFSAAEPDIILGSSYEAKACNAAYFGITYPDRSRISISARPLAGVEGGLTFIEGTLNALMNFQAKKR